MLRDVDQLLLLLSYILHCESLKFMQRTTSCMNFQTSFSEMANWLEVNEPKWLDVLNSIIRYQHNVGPSCMYAALGLVFRPTIGCCFFDSSMPGVQV